MVGNKRKAKVVFNQLSEESKRFVPMGLLEYAFQKVAPEIFLYNLSKEATMSRIDGCNAEATALKVAATIIAKMNFS